MNIRFGLHLDGQRGWHPASQLGYQRLGPLGLLNILETQLGLLRDQPSQSERIVQYRDCLKRCDHAERFYRRSFATDELGTAATLLGWRDLWHLHGWSGKFEETESARLRDLGEVEQLAAGAVAPSVGERLARVLAVMQHRRPAIERIILEEALNAFPRRWQEVLTHLPVEIIEPVRPQGSGFLGELQSALLRAQAGESVKKLAWRQDGTISVVQAETRFLSGRWLAQQMMRATDTLIVAGQDAALLDGILVEDDLPRQGFRETSAFRPALQVLPLALELVWEPMNFYALLQFLTHPVCPVPGFARHKLAGVLADQPGIGGDSWKKTLVEIDAHFGSKAVEIRKIIQRWVECPRFPHENGAPIPALLERVRWLDDFFQVRLADADPARRIAFNAGFSQSRACAEALEGLLNQGVNTLLPVQLQKLVAQATARGSDNPLLKPEVGACLTVSEPGAAVEAVDRVIWWQLEMPAMPANYPWSRTEIGQLADAGAGLPPLADELERTARDWLRPILAARKQLVLVLPPKGSEVHPVWLMIEALVDGLPVRSLESLLTEQDTEGTRPVLDVPLPAKRRWWELPAGVSLIQKYRDSYSSLELFLFNPYHWVLRYPAALKTARILSVGNEFRLFGNLAHSIVERFFRQSDALNLDEKACLAWFDSAFDQTVLEEGATLLMPGRRSDLEGFRIKLRASFIHLRHQISRAGVVKVDPELELAGHYAGGELGGYADLVLTKADGSQAVVDMKWSGKKFVDLLKENRHLQLTIYAELLRQKGGAWPRVAYYVLDRGQLLATSDEFFPEARLVRKDSEETTAHLWQRFTESWKWRRKQLDAGKIELVLEEIEETEESVSPDTGLLPQVLYPGYNDYLHLAGWEE